MKRDEEDSEGKVGGRVGEESLSAKRKKGCLRRMYDHISKPLWKPFEENWPESLQNIFVVASIVGAAIWAAYTFEVLQQRQKAEKDLEALTDQMEEREVQLEKTQLEIDGLRKRLEQTFATSVRIKSKYQRLQDERYGIFVEVEIKNVSVNDIVTQIQVITAI